MSFIIIFLTVGIGLGLLIQKIAVFAKTSEKVLTILYYPFLFLLAIFFRLDVKIVSNIDKIGWHSFFNIVVGFATVITLIWLVTRLSKLLIQLKKN